MKTAMDYTASITVKASAMEVFKALTTAIPLWWTSATEGASLHQGDQFTVRFGNTFKVFKVEQSEPAKRVVWNCVDAYIDMPELKERREWIGTEMIWEISNNGNETVLLFVHRGLTSEFECYDICEEGWDFFIKESLLQFFTTGKGLPHHAR